LRASECSRTKNLRRTINGTLIDLAPPQFRKYASEITGNDQTSPALSGVWPGRQVVVDCVSELSYATTGGAPERTVVPGSSRVDGDYTFYRPRLTFRVTDYSQDTDEWGAVVSWSLSLEEV
jgi:hypothetical protein